MSTTELILVAVVAVALVAAVGYSIVRLRRRHTLRDQFGDEYEIVLEEHGSKRQADRELAARQDRHDHLDIRPLDPQLHRTPSSGVPPRPASSTSPPPPSKTPTASSRT